MNELREKIAAAIQQSPSNATFGDEADAILALSEIQELLSLRAKLAEARAVGEMLAAVVQGAQEEFVRVPYGASHEDVAQINDWHSMAREAMGEWSAFINRAMKEE